jgi:hypothetical protein
VVVFIVLGALLLVVDIVIQASVVGSRVGSAEASVRVETAVIPTTTALDSYPANAKACNGKLSCVTRLDRNVAATLNTFAGQLKTISMPSGQATSADAALVSSVTHTAGIFARLGAATSASQYDDIVNSAGLQQSVNQFNQNFTNLGLALSP